jgi:hypothetical protein
VKAIPTTEAAKRLAALNHRQLTTPWTEKEIATFKSLHRAGAFTSFDDLELVERYYAENWPPCRNKNILRHDLKTFLNNYPGEVDRARAWCEKHALKGTRKIIPLPPVKSEPFIASTDPEEISAHQRFLDDLAERKRLRGELPMSTLIEKASESVKVKPNAAQTS